MWRDDPNHTHTCARLPFRVRSFDVENVAGAADVKPQLAAGSAQIPYSRDLRLFGRETLIGNRRSELFELQAISGLQLRSHASPIQADYDRFNSGKFLDGHAHGVSANGSIHAKDCKINFAQFGVGPRYQRQRTD